MSCKVKTKRDRTISIKILLSFSFNKFGLQPMMTVFALLAHLFILVYKGVSIETQSEFNEMSSEQQSCLLKLI